jgi:4-hydroxybenzoate polyprenyltransferase
MAYCTHGSCRRSGSKREHKHVTFFLYATFAWLTTNISNFINDYFDIESDITGRPHSPLASGAITRDLARNVLLIEYVISFLLLFGTALVTESLLVLSLGIIPLICTYIYSVPPFKTKDRAAAGPVTISAAYMSVALGGWALASELTIEAIKLGIFFAILMLGIGFSKDFMHIEADRGFSSTPPIAYGVRKTAAVAAISLTFPILLSQQFINISTHEIFLLITPLSFSIMAIFFMIKEPEAKNRDIVMSAFLVYLNAVFIIIYVNSENILVIILSTAVSGAISMKTWFTDERFATIRIKYLRILSGIRR